MEVLLNTPTIAQVSFGSAYSGLSTVGYELKNLDGSSFRPRSTTDIVDEGNGYYHAYIVIDQPWRGYIEWTIAPGSSILAREDIEVLTELSSVIDGVDTFTYTYKSGLKRQILDGLNAVFNTNLPDTRYQDIFVGWEFPLEQIHYPAIYINYAEGPIENVGVGSLERGTDDFNNPIEVYHAKFEGVLNFNVLALNPEDRDNLSAILLSIIQHGRIIPNLQPFYRRIEDGRFIQIQLLNDLVTPSGEQTAPVPWGNQDELIFGNRYSVKLFGDFYSSITTGELITIDDVELFPYRDDQPAPW